MRLHFSLIISLGAMLAAVLSPAIALAHARVVASTPAEAATVAKPRALAITFSDVMLPPKVATTIVMTAMPGMANHPLMTIRNYVAAWSNDNRTITLNLRKALVAGSYELRWEAVGTDGHRMAGKISFTVS